MSLRVSERYLCDTNMDVPDYKFILHGNVSWKELLSRTKHLKFAKVKAKLKHLIKSWHCFFVLANFLLCDDQLESRMTPFQEREDDKDMKTIQPLESRTTPFQEGEDDEDIPTMRTTPPTINGPITRSRAMQIHDQVNANLSISFDLENMVVP